MDMRMIEQLAAQKSLRDLDYALATVLAARYGETNADVILAAALASRVEADGHTCLDLEAVAGKPWPETGAGTGADDDRPGLQSVLLPSIGDWLPRLEQSPMCDAAATGIRAGNRPFVLANRHLYVRRFYNSEQRIAERLIRLAREDAGGAIRDEDRRRVEAIFPPETEGNDGPRKAAGIALTRRLLILSGGPGTGKTFTLARLLELLIRKAAAENRTPVIKLAAPTGKAAMRMQESIQKAKQAARERNAIAADIPEEAVTLHRLLGPVRNSPYFRFNAGNPLPADIVIIDEASMIALPMMDRLLDALKPGAQLILLGDRNQLSSVEPGYVLGDICAAARQADSPLHGTLVELTHSWRFRSTGPVGRLSAALRQAGTEDDPDGAKAWQLATELPAVDPAGEDLAAPDRFTLHASPASLRPENKAAYDDLQATVLEGFGALMNADRVEDAFRALARFRILCALRGGPYGVDNLNRLVEDILSRKHSRDSGSLQTRRLDPSGPFYDHRVIMITRNDYGLNLFNGDVGILLPDHADQPAGETGGSGNLVAWFETTAPETGAKGFRKIPCSMLPEHETAFAMTIHKSQGSEFAQVLLMLPPTDNPVLTKELIYTGITRVVRNTVLWCNEDVFKAAAIRRTERASGLAAALRPSSAGGA